jgi:hypothetical protein
MAKSAEMQSDELQWHFIENFVKYTKWPTTSILDHFAFCVVGHSAMTTLSLSSQVMQKQSLVIKAFEDRLPSQDELKDCHAIYFSNTLDYGKLNFLLSQLDKLPILSISDNVNFIRQGGLIQFVSVGNKLRFMIDGQTARVNGLKIAPALLRLSQKKRTG